MASSADYARWIVANSDKKGTADFDTVAKAYQAARTSESADTGSAAAPPAAAAAAKPLIPDAANAVVTGMNRVPMQLAGLPADTLSNIIDLGKSAIGSAYLAATPRDADHRLPGWLEPVDRSNVPLTSDWLMKKARQVDPNIVDAQNPAYQGGYLQTAGTGLGAVVSPRSRMELAQQVGTGVLGSMAAKGAVDATGNPSAGVIGALLPHAGTQAATIAAKTAVRGGEAGRQAMAQRVADLQAAGIENPTLGLASGNSMIGGVENLLANTPGAVGIMRRAREEAVNGMQAKTDAAAANASGNRGTMESGSSIQAGVKQAQADSKATQGTLYDRLDQFIPGGQQIPVGQTGDALGRLTSTIPGAEATSKSFINGKINGIKQGFDVDTGTVPSGPTTTASVPMLGVPAMRTNAMGLQVPAGPVVGVSNGVIRPMGTPPPEPAPGMRAMLGGASPTRAPVAPISTSTPILGAAPMRTDAMGLQVPAGNLIGTRTDVIPPRAGRSGPFSGIGVADTSPPTLPFEAVKQLRTSVGTELNNNALVQDAPKAQWKQLYGAMSGDIQNAATAAGPDAASAFNRANDYTRASIGRLEKVAPVVDKPSPEQTFQSLNRSLAENTSTFQAVKKTLPEGARGDFAGTVIERLGKATAGQQDSTGGAWSPETFLTNWNRMAPKARDELLSGFPNSDQVRADVQKVADAASLMRTNSKMWANPSGTSANAAARGTIGAIGAGALLAPFGLINPAVPITAAGAVGASNLIGRAVTSKAVRDAAMRQDSVSKPLSLTDMLLLNATADKQRANQ